MNPPRSKWPSLGFVAVCLTYGLVAFFFVWGFSTPRLDRVWTIRNELKIGHMRKLKKSDRRLLLKTLGQHPWVASEFLDNREIGLISAESDGWISTPVATVLRTDQSRPIGTLVFDVQTPPDLMPYRMLIRGRAWKKELRVEKHGILRFELPQPPPVAEIIEIQMKGKKFGSDPSMLGLRISFSEKT